MRCMGRLGTVLPPEEARVAQEMLECAPHKRGKIVLRVAAMAEKPNEVVPYKILRPVVDSVEVVVRSRLRLFHARQSSDTTHLIHDPRRGSLTA